MKQIIFFLITIVLLTNTAYSQCVFQGIPLGQHIDKFSKELELKNYVYLHSEEENKQFTGNFNSEDCLVIVAFTPLTKKVYTVMVLFEKEYFNWLMAKKNMEEWRNRLSTKYGTPYEIKTFESPYEEGDGYEMSALAKRKLLYRYDYNHLDYRISLALVNFDRSGRIVIGYSDIETEKLNEKEKYTDF